MSVSAAAMARAGKGNYQTCYNNIVKFQILDEIESLFEMRLDKGHENTVNQLQVGAENLHSLFYRSSSEDFPQYKQQNGTKGIT